MPGEVFREGGIVVTVHVERGGRHHEPLCHVRWQGGEASVRLPDLTVLSGTPLDRRVREVLARHLDGVVRRWQQDNAQ